MRVPYPITGDKIKVDNVSYRDFVLLGIKSIIVSSFSKIKFKFLPTSHPEFKFKSY